MTQNKLKTKIGEIKLKNPTLLAAGIMGLTGSSLKKIKESGAGGTVTKSFGKKPKKGHPGPNVVETPCGLLNAMGLPNPGLKQSIKEIKKYEDTSKPTIASIFGKEKKEIKKMVKKLEKTNISAIELNLSCPHAEKLSLIGHSPKLTKKMTKISKKTKLPIWVKLPPKTNIPKLKKVAKAAEKANADAIVVTNTIPGMSIDIKSKKPILGNKKGGLSGPAIKPVGVRLVYELYEVLNIPIIGVGGITTGKDMLEYILAGATAVQIGTGIMKRNLTIFKKICEEAKPHLKGKKITDLIGKAHNN